MQSQHVKLHEKIKTSSSLVKKLDLFAIFYRQTDSQSIGTIWVIVKFGKDHQTLKQFVFYLVAMHLSSNIFDFIYVNSLHIFNAKLN